MLSAGREAPPERGGRDQAGLSLQPPRPAGARLQGRLSGAETPLPGQRPIAPPLSPVPAAERWAAGAETCPVQERVSRQVGVTAQKTMRLLPASGRKATQKVVAVAARSWFGSSRQVIFWLWRVPWYCC